MKVGFGLIIDLTFRRRGGWSPDTPGRNYWTDDAFAVALAAALQNTDRGRLRIPSGLLTSCSERRFELAPRRLMLSAEVSGASHAVR